MKLILLTYFRPQRLDTFSFGSIRRNDSHLWSDRVRNHFRVRCRRHVHPMQVRNDNKDVWKFLWVGWGLGIPWKPEIPHVLSTCHCRRRRRCVDVVRLLNDIHPFTFFRTHAKPDGDRQMKLNNELNNMSWRVRPDEVLLEIGRLFGSKMGLQKLNYEVCQDGENGADGCSLWLAIGLIAARMRWAIRLEWISLCVTMYI